MSDYVPEELLIQILTRVHPRSLIKFRCVSKSWNSLISSPNFVSLQTNHAIISKPTNLPSTQILIRCRDEIQDKEIYAVYNDNGEHIFRKNIRIEYPFDTTRYCYNVFGPCNGVLCLSYSQPHNDILLWNPVIKRRVALPSPRVALPNTQWMSTVRCAVGFGFDVVNNDYKVVRLAYVKGDKNPPKVEVYSLSVRNWREINVVEYPRNCILNQFWRHVFVNGNVHWMACRKDEENVFFPKSFIMRFDMSIEVFDEMSLPQVLEHYKISLKPAVIRESLALFQQDGYVCSIWIMNKYGDIKSWSKMFNVGLSRDGTIHGFRVNGDILLSDWGRRLVSCNLDTGACVKLEISGSFNSCYVLSYVESLALLNEGEVVREKVSLRRKRGRLSRGRMKMNTLK